MICQCKHIAYFVQEQSLQKCYEITYSSVFTENIDRHTNEEGSSL